MDIGKSDKLAVHSNKITLFTLTWPLFAQSFLGLLMGNVNVLMLSRYSDNAVGSVGFSNQVMGLLIVVYSVVGTGTAIVVSQYIGAGMRNMASKVANIAIIANLGFGIIVSISLVVFAKQLLTMMNVPPEFMDYAYTYTAIVGAASFTRAIMTIMTCVAGSYGYTKFPMFVSICMNIVNVIGTYIAIFRPFGIPSYGVAGVAVSSVISQVFGVIFMAFILYKKLGIYFSIKFLYPLPIKILKELFKVGTPAAAETISYTITQIVTIYFVSMIGAIAITTKVYAGSITFFIYILGFSIGQGTQILIGHMVGAGKEAQAYARAVKSLKIAFVSNLLMSIIFITFGRQIFGIFTQDTSIINIGCTILIIDFMVEAGRAFNHVIGCSLRGAGDVKFPMFVSIISMWGLSVPLCYILGIWFKLGLNGIWIAFAIDECFRGLVLLRRWMKGTWRRMALVKINESGDGSLTH